MNQQVMNQLADYLSRAEQNRQGVKPLTKLVPDIQMKDAYQVQLLIVQRKVESGQKIVGKKIGLTSLAMQQLLGVDQPDYGHLLDSMIIENGRTLSLGQVIQPKVEAEIAFVLKSDLIGPNVTAEDVILATDYIVPALEIVDSRIENWQIKLEDTVADNASSSHFVLGGSPTQVDTLDLMQFSATLMKNGEVMNKGVGADVLGGPALCVAWLANKLQEFGITLSAGEVILSGALSAAVDVQPGDYVQAVFDHIGEVSVRFGA
ncbi:2-keto-4-pentenoate hydratase [Brevibacillus sp. NRS-1366]|uniref:2-keto-4-pentenoate hydratase n=1 Tax=Brevibacillus sp. NRS-1366 TaxID=3233899 RepID=UPI003D25DF57